MKIKGPYAYPLEYHTFEWRGDTHTKIYHRQHGMTLRDHFAALAMQALVASRTSLPGDEEGRRMIAVEAYMVADAMLVERASRRSL